MNGAAQGTNHLPTPNRGRMMDFAPTAHPATPERQPSNQLAKPAATPVTSAKAAINARYAANPSSTSAKMVSSAREAMNRSVASAPSSPKSASNLHHGSIQRSMESTRTSASALLRRSAKPAPKPPRIIESKNSYDPLAHVPQSPTRVTRPAYHQDVAAPTVKTSLKLGQTMRPKQSPVILPADAKAKRLSNLLAAQKRRNPNATPNPAYRGSSVRDPQMVARRTYSEQEFARRQAYDTAKNAKMADIIDAELGAPGRIVVEEVREPEETRETLVAQDISRIAEATIAERVPQPLEVKRTAEPADLGVVEDYAEARTGLRRRSTMSSVSQKPEVHLPNEDRANAPMSAASRAVARKVAPGSNNFKADNSPTYSFTRPKEQNSNAFHAITVRKPEKTKPSGKNRYSATEKSPFLKSVQVDKRPLSDSSIPPQPTLVNPSVTTRGERKKEVKRAKAKQQQQNLPSRPTVIIPASRRSRAPLFFLILLTVILGAIVGTATYFFFFNEF